MKISARNQFQGKVTAINVGQVNDEVILDLGKGEQIAAIVTRASVHALGLSVGKEAVALFKAPWVILAAADHGMKFSARNALQGKVDSVVRGSINSVVELTTESGLKLSAVVTNDSAEAMQLSNGSSVTALIKASNVILAVAAE
ncbi:MAG: TOBE domain-containing protein [Enterobacteriaceae bacterium]